MKKIGISQRLALTKYGELRSQLDLRLLNLISHCGYNPIIIPYFDFKNKSKSLKRLSNWLNENKFSGIILSGGDDIGKFILRDDCENLLIKFALKRKIPVFGICRGMQIIGRYFKVKLIKVNNHVKKNHFIYFKKKKLKVNRFHNFAIKKCPKNFEIEFVSNDGSIESIISKSKKIYACMWHPERYKKFKKPDIKNLKKLFK